MHKKIMKIISMQVMIVLVVVVIIALVLVQVLHQKTAQLEEEIQEELAADIVRPLLLDDEDQDSDDSLDKQGDSLISGSENEPEQLASLEEGETASITDTEDQTEDETDVETKETKKKDDSSDLESTTMEEQTMTEDTAAASTASPETLPPATTVQETAPATQAPTTAAPTTAAPTTAAPATQAPTTAAPTTAAPTAAAVEKATPINYSEDRTYVTETQATLFKNRLLKDINDLRSSMGLSTLTMDSCLASGASIRANEISTQWSHTRPNGERGLYVLEGCGGYLADAIYCVRNGLPHNYAMGENLAVSYSWSDYTGLDQEIIDLADDVFNNWKESPSHYENLIYAGYTKVGLGLYVNMDEDIYHAFWVCGLFFNK